MRAETNRKRELTDGLNVIGRTVDGRLVIGNVFKYVGTLGVPLSDIIIFLSGLGFVPAMDRFISDAVSHGWNRQTAMSYVDSALREATAHNLWVKEH